MPQQIETMSRTERQRRMLEQRAQEASRHSISRLLNEIHGRAHRAAHWKMRHKQHTDRLEELTKKNPDEAGLNVFQKSTYWAVLVGLLAVLCIDFLLLRATADWFISMGFYGIPDWLNMVLTALVPLAVLLLELVTAEQYINAREEAAAAGQRGSLGFWAIFSLLLVIVIPSFSVATYWAMISADIEPGKAIPPHYVLQMAGLLCLSLVVHASVVYGGSLSRNARSYFIFFLQRLSLNRQVRAAQARYNRESEAAGRTYRDYADALEAHNNRFTDARVLGGPFEKVAVEIINDIYPNAIQAPLEEPPPNAPVADVGGHTVREAPGADSNGYGAPSQAAPTSHWPGQQPFENNNGHQVGEDDYYRTLVEGQIRNAEGEVTA